MTGLPVFPLFGLLFVAVASEGPSAPARVGGSIKEPRKVKHVDPEYPADASRAGLAGRVVLECLIDPQGQVVKTDLLDGVSPLAEAAAAAVKKWRYTPTLVDGVATPVIMTVTATFDLGTRPLAYYGLLGSLDHRNEHIRKAASLHLGNLVVGTGIDEGHLKKAIRALEPLAAKDESPRVRAAAARSLSRLDGRPLPEGLAETAAPTRRERSAVAWGQFVDPSGQSGIQTEADRVVIWVPAGRRDLAAEAGPLLAPRLVRPVAGDFDAEVKVDSLPEPGPPLGRGSYRGAGLLLWQDERNYVRLESAVYRLRHETYRPGAVDLLRTGDVRYALFEVRRGGKPIGGLSPADVLLEQGPAELRLERRGTKVLGLVRQRGSDWRKVGEAETDLTDPLEIGVAAVSIAAKELRVGFEGFSTKPAGELARAIERLSEEAPEPGRGNLPEHDRPAAAGYDSAPRPLRITRPKYPQEAYANKIEGTVVVEILIDTQGQVAEARVIQSVPGLDEAALAAARSWRFQPAVKHGRPVPTIAHAPVAFRLW